MANIVDEFCKWFLKHPGDVYEKYNEFVDTTGNKTTFNEFVDCVKVAGQLQSIDPSQRKKFINYIT